VVRKRADRVPKHVGDTKFEIPDLKDLSAELSSGVV